MPKLAVVVIVAAFAVAISSAFVLVVMNRASEKVISASVPIALAALAGIVLVFLFSEEPNASRVFPVLFVRSQSDATPIGVRYRRDFDAHFMAARLLNENPKLAADARLLYHHLLQKALFEWIATRHFGAWDSEHLTFDTGSKTQTFGPAPGSSEPSLTFSREDLEEILGQNMFAKVAPAISMGLAVPPDTSVTIKAPTREVGSEGVIRFENRLCTLTLVTSMSGGGVGLGPYIQFTGIPIDEAQRKFWSENYVVRGTASFNRWRVGDPKLPLIRRWAVQILDGLQQEFDEQIIWREARENFLLRQAAGPGGFVGRGDVARYLP